MFCRTYPKVFSVRFTRKCFQWCTRECSEGYTRECSEGYTRKCSVRYTRKCCGIPGSVLYGIPGSGEFLVGTDPHRSVLRTIHYASWVMTFRLRIGILWWNEHGDEVPTHENDRAKTRFPKLYFRSEIPTHTHVCTTEYMLYSCAYMEMSGMDMCAVKELFAVR